MNSTNRPRQSEWEYEGVTGPMNRHSWTNGHVTVSIYWMSGHGSHVGWMVKATDKQLSNGFIESFEKALVIADLHMRDQIFGVASFLPSDRVESERGGDGFVPQSEWLDAHAHDYEFVVIDPEKISQ